MILLVLAILALNSTGACDMNWILLAVATLQPLGTYSSRVGCEMEIKQIIRNDNPMPYYWTPDKEPGYKASIDSMYNVQKDYLCVRNKPQSSVDKPVR